jgi:type II secretory pathway component GspD/PulD (secretin)
MGPHILSRLWLSIRAYRGWAAGLLMLCCVAAQAQSLEIIALKSRPADQVLPVIQPLLAPGGTASGSGFQLFVRTTPANLAQIRQVVASLDRAARQLVIYVKQDAAGQGSRSDLNAGIILSPGNSSVRGSIEGSSVSSRDAVAQQLRTQEGVPAYISAGTSEPLVARSVTRTVNGVVVQESVVQRDINSGFYVTPRVNGDTVFLDIGTQRDTPGTLGPGSADTNRIASTVSGKLGAWIELGGASTAQSAQSRGALSRSSSADASARSTYVRVEEVR